MNACKSWAVALIAFLLLPSVAASADVAKEACEKGNAFLDKGDFDSAIAAFTEAIRMKPKDVQTYCNRGNAYRRSAYIARQSTTSMKPSESNQTLSKRTITWGMCILRWPTKQRQVADYEKAIQIGLKMKSIDKTNRQSLAIAYYNHGSIDSQRGDTEHILLDFTEAIRLDPQYADAYINRGIILSRNGDFRKAIADFDDAIRLQPDRAPGYNGRAWCYSDTGDSNKAIADFTKAILIDPSLVSAYYGRRTAYANKVTVNKSPSLRAVVGWMRGYDSSSNIRRTRQWQRPEVRIGSGIGGN